MKRTERIPGQREAILATLRSDQHPPAGATRDEVRQWARRKVDLGWREGEVAIALGWTVDEVRRAVAERAS